MFHFKNGNLLDSQVQALVNTVNTVGVMGKGIALAFKQRFPENFRLYANACRDGRVRVGTMFVTEHASMLDPKWIVNFPTKQHWRNPSRMEWITNGLQDLRRFLVEKKVQSVALPALGAGNGGLPWAEVRQQIERALHGLETDVFIFEPLDR